MKDTWTVTITYRDIDGMEYAKSVLLDGEQVRRGYVSGGDAIAWTARVGHQEVKKLVEATRTDADRG